MLKVNPSLKTSRGFCEHQQLAFYDVKVSCPNAESYRSLEPQNIHSMHENEKCQYSMRVLDIEHETFTTLIFTTTDGMGQECSRYHSRLAKVIVSKKREQHAISFFLIWCDLIGLKGFKTNDKSALRCKECWFLRSDNRGKEYDCEVFRFYQLLIDFLKVVIWNMDFISGHRWFHFINFFSKKDWY